VASLSLPQLPEKGSRAWYEWAAGLHDQMAGRLSEDALRAALGTVAEEVPPAGFAFAHLALPQALRLGGGRFRVLLDVDALRPAAGATYHVAPAAPAGAAGTAAAPMRLGEALAKPDVGTVIFAPGEYDRSSHATPVLTKSVNFLASAPGVRVTGWNGPNSTAWTLLSGSIYQTTRSGTSQVVDVANRTPWGDYVTYTKKATAAEITGPGQWSIEGSTVSVWALGSTDLSVTANRSQIRIGVTARTGIVASAGVSYIRGIDFEGCDDGGAQAQGTATVIAEDCTFKYSLGNGGVQAIGGHGYIAIRCTASSNVRDGFNYHGSGGVSPDVVEIDCRSHHNGLTPGASTNNASTAHEACRVLRAGGDYDLCAGPIVADVNNARSWNLGCRSGRSVAPGTQAQSWRVDATGYETDPARMHLVQCIAEHSTPYRTTGGGVFDVRESWPVYVA
jgi:hypothetical protein